MTDTAGTPLASAMDLLQAIDERRLLVYYQAISDPVTREVKGAEALVRWEHELLGVLEPAAFLPADMSGGLGWALTNFVLEEAVRQCGLWRRGGLDIGVSVNIAPGRLADDVLPAHIAAVLERSRVPPHLLTVEITEQRCSADPTGIRRALVALSRLGVRISLDDFGTGDSSLRRLRQLHFDEVKIDREFVTNLATEPADRHIVRFATGLAHDLGIRVVAEGVETEPCLAVLASLGVDLVQGYLLHRPAPAADFPP